MFEVLSQSPIFFGVSAEQLKQQFENIVYRIAKFQKDEIVAYKDDECNKLMILLSGSVRGEMFEYSGKTLKIEDIEAPRPLAIAFLFGKDNHFPVTIIANTSTEVISIPKAEVLKLLQSNEVFLNNYLNSICNRSQFLSQKLSFISFKSLKEKIMHYLIGLSRDNIKWIELNKSHQELADLFGVTRPSLSRSLGELVKEGVIEIQHKNIRIIEGSQFAK